MYDKQIFADNLAHFMKIHRETQVDVAKMIGVSKSNVSAYIRGEQIPRMDKVQILADHYGVRLSDLLETKKAPAEAEASEDVVIRFFRSLPLEQQRGILLALGAPPEVLAALDQQAPNE